MQKIKLRFLAIALVMIIFTFCTQTTLAYYTTVGKATNVITTGNIRFIVHETTEQGTEFPEEGVYIMPGEVVSKEVKIESDCEHPFYLRVKMVYGINSTELSSDDCFKLNIDSENWRFFDGWYYYKGIVQPGDTTPSVFSKVEIVGNKVDNNYIGKTLSLTVVAHAVQSENNPVEGNNTHEALGWPVE